MSEQAGGQIIERAELGSLSALKTYAPPLESLVGRKVAGAQRRGKYLCIQAEDLWLVTHLARAGWLHWRDPVPPARVRPGKGPLALRVGLVERGRVRPDRARYGKKVGPVAGNRPRRI